MQSECKAKKSDSSGIAIIIHLIQGIPELGTIPNLASLLYVAQVRIKSSLSLLLLLDVLSFSKCRNQNLLIGKFDFYLYQLIKIYKTRQGIFLKLSLMKIFHNHFSCLAKYDT